MMTTSCERPGTCAAATHGPSASSSLFAARALSDCTRCHVHAAGKDMVHPLAALVAASTTLMANLEATHPCAGLARLIHQESLRLEEAMGALAAIGDPIPDAAPKSHRSASEMMFELHLPVKCQFHATERRLR